MALAANLFAVLGLVMSLGSGLIRLGGSYHLFGYSAMTIFTAGTGLIVVACLLKIELLLRRLR